MKKIIKEKHLRFPIDAMWPTKSTWLDKLIARMAAARILNGSSRTYQFGGYTGAKKLAYEMVDAEKEQLAHWLLRDCGYNCCVVDIMKVMGRDPDAKS